MKKLKNIFTINRGLIISRYEHFENNCPNCNNSIYIIKQQWNYEQKKFCVKINQKFITKKGDIIIKTNYPFKLKYIKDEENLIVSSNHIIIKSSLVSNLIDTNQLAIFLQKELIDTFLKSIDSLKNKYLITLKKTMIESFKINTINFKNHMMEIKKQFEEVNSYFDKKILSINDLLNQKIIDQKQFDELKNEIIELVLH
ncbi:hypothetical protein [Spiroplasma diminutum]|uniref:Uncharacterized protein n=1 Tax=Spiroplasma diminutum CUAS-1 TaxID=1276221 RepID=S5M2E3_9MOLU|nr:hypothetical protein [Spiroplasma diminutum]AGR42242.1 hypothetical protein SDIMI_v3c05380 [Spiroplasma diminutum CUAS-1]